MIKQIQIDYTDEIELDKSKISVFRMFTQSMLNRLTVGELRYGAANRKQKYMTRMLKEMSAYVKNGNAEHLFNIANYCVLEWIAPEHSRHRLDTTVESVTRED